MEKAKDELTQFTHDFFDYFGAKVKQAGRKGNKHLAVTLPDALQDRFGKDKMNIVFDTEQSDGQRELVASGSRAFDQMLVHLNDCGALTYQQLPTAYAGGEELMQAIRPTNASISALKMSEQTHSLYVFHWRITYRADDKREALYRVVLDENGQRISIEESKNKVSDGDDLTIDLQKIHLDAEPVPVEHDEAGQPLPAKLPPMTRLTELAEQARQYAIYHADLECVHLESEIQPRLYKSLSRLHNYYSQQIEEVYESHDQSGEKRKLLETDLQRKLAEEVENHRLRVQVSLFSYAIIQMPVAVADLTLSDGKQEVKIEIKRNRYTGKLQRARCHSCRSEVTDIAIDKNGHITCNECLHQCTTCLTIHCSACGVNTCPVCEKSNCETCSHFCWACGERACQDHASQCPACFDTVCHSCQEECAHCGTQQCVSHLRSDSVPTVDGVPHRKIGHFSTQGSSHALICNECAIRCTNCQQYSAHFDLCASSGQRFCLNCLGTCTDCERVVGPQFFHVNVDDKKIYCVDCVTVCPSCQTPTSEVQHCQECANPCCTSCNQTCMTCEQLFCAEHAHKQKECDHIFCTVHSGTCEIGGEEVCTACSEACAICARDYCTDHEATCELCRLSYCIECVRRGTQLCDTCATIRDHGSSVYMADEPVAKHRDVEPLVHRYRWQRSGNERYVIYLGQGPFNSGALILAHAEEVDDPLIVVRKLSAIDKYWRKY